MRKNCTLTQHQCNTSYQLKMSDLAQLLMLNFHSTELLVQAHFSIQ